MNCDKCPHQVEIKTALDPCQSCKLGHLHHSGGHGATCKGCPVLEKILNAMHPCCNCNAGRLHDQVSMDAAPDPELVLAHAKPNDHSAQTGVTKLAPEAENALRIALATVFSFDPVEILLLRHILAGGSYASFNRPLRELADRLARYDLAEGAPGFRSLAQTWGVRMMKAMPSIEPVFRATIEENGGHSRPLRY